MAPRQPNIDTNLTVALHTLAAVQNEARILGPLSDCRRGNNSRVEAVQSIFPTAAERDKFIDVLQAIVALCTTYPGPDSVAVLLACTPEHPTVRLYLCHNSDTSSESLRTHLQHVWRLLCRLRPGTKETPPRRVDDHDSTIRKLTKLAHAFVFRKVLKRASGKADKVRILNERTDIPAECKPLLLCYFYVTQVAKLVDPDVALDTQKNWICLLTFLTDLYHLTKEPGYAIKVKRLQMFVPSGSDYFDVDKSIRKTIKINTAVISLVNLARSPKRGWVLERDLEVQSVDLPELLTLQIPVKDFAPFLPSNLTKGEFYSKLLERQWKEEEEDEVPVSVTRKTHSECQLAAAVFDNEALPGGPPVIPYISCSKLHCVFCHSWLGLFNQTGKAMLGFDGTHGSIRRGWHPPTLQDLAQHAAVVEGLTSQVNTWTLVQSTAHRKETSVSSTLSNPTESQFPSWTDEEQRLREQGIAKVTAALSLPLTPAPSLPLSTPATAAIPAGISSPSLAQSTPQSWATLAASDAQKWGSTKKTTPSALQPPAPSTSGPVPKIPPSSLGDSRGRGEGSGRGQGEGRGRGQGEGRGRGQGEGSGRGEGRGGGQRAGRGRGRGEGRGGGQSEGSGRGESRGRSGRGQRSRPGRG
ncbi:hypothetical protein C8R47DRAFT_1192878 [Mycena vitilis]|nr:hypothetical protein C8R47DRAFT_1192878 [Mycena vitilis]